MTVDQMKKYCTHYDSTYGKIKELQFQGYSFLKGIPDNRQLIHLSGINIRERINTPIGILIERKSKKIVAMKFEF